MEIYSILKSTKRDKRSTIKHFLVKKISLNGFKVNMFLIKTISQEKPLTPLAPPRVLSPKESTHGEEMEIL